MKLELERVHILSFVTMLINYLFSDLTPVLMLEPADDLLYFLSLLQLPGGRFSLFDPEQ